MQVRLQGIQAKFVYEVYRFKVTAVKCDPAIPGLNKRMTASDGKSISLIQRCRAQAALACCCLSDHRVKSIF